MSGATNSTISSAALKQPVRYYSSTRNSNGETVAFSMNLGNMDERHLVDAVIKHGVINPDEIKVWLVDSGIPYEEADLKMLHKHLLLIRCTKTPSTLIPKDNAFTRLQDALSTIEEELPKIMLVNETATSRYEVRAIELERLAAAVERFRQFWGHDVSSRNHKFREWHDDALFLARVAKDISEKNGKPVHWKSARSPVVRFVALALNGALGSLRARTPDGVRQALLSHPDHAILS